MLYVISFEAMASEWRSFGRLRMASALHGGLPEAIVQCSFGP